MPASGIVVSRPVVQASNCFMKHGLGFRCRQSGWACGVTILTVSTGADAAGTTLPGSFFEEVPGRSSEDGGGVFIVQLQKWFILQEPLSPSVRWG